MAENVKEQILALSRQMTRGGRPVDHAKRRGWLDESGRPTKEGRKLVDAMGDQSGTRTVFRPFV